MRICADAQDNQAMNQGHHPALVTRAIRETRVEARTQATVRKKHLAKKLLKNRELFLYNNRNGTKKKKPSQKFLGRLFDFSMCLLLSFRLEFVRWILLACQAALAVVFPLFCVLEYFCRL